MGDRLSRVALAGACALAVVLVSACSVIQKGNAATGASTHRSAKGPIKVAYFELQQANSFVHAEYAGMKSVADAEHVKLVTYDGNLQSGQQVSQIQNATSAGGFDGYLVEAVTNAALFPVKQAIGRGVKVVSVNFPFGPDQATGASQVPGQVATVLTPASADGAHVGELVVRACGSAPCQVGVVVGGTAVPSEQAKLSAIRSQVAAHHNIRIVGVGQAGFTTAGGITATQNLLQAHRQINVLATTGDDMSLGAAKSLSQLGRAGAVKLIGGGGSSTAVTAIRAGQWFGTTTKLPYTEGQIAMRALIAAIRGDGRRGQSFDPVASPLGRSLGPLLDRRALGRNPHFKGQWSA